jgi:hypothetical protein
MRKPSWFVAGALAAMVASVGCYPERFEATNYDAVATLNDTTANFASASTFFLTPVVVHLVAPGEPDNITRAHDALILSTITTNMTNRGYAAAVDSATADLKLVVLVGSSTYQGYYWSYWCDFYGWYGGCYYPPYWGTYYEYTLGTIMIGMADNRAVAPGGVAPLIWFAAANGLVTSASTATRITNAINQAFIQSPYIQS